jgi:hypothetical protein
MVYPFLGSYLCIYKYFKKKCLRGVVITQDWSKDVLVLACVWHSTDQKWEIVQPKSKCHRWMNRRPIGSSVKSSGEGVYALSCSLLENFLPSDELTPSRFTPSVHPVLKFSSFHRPAPNCSDASILQAIGPSDGGFHPGTELHQRFDRRYWLSTVGSSDTIQKRGSRLSY